MQVEERSTEKKTLALKPMSEQTMNIEIFKVLMQELMTLNVNESTSADYKQCEFLFHIFDT